MNDTHEIRTVWSWWHLLFLVEFIAVMWPPLYNKVGPAFIGMPFFYWYQLLWVLIAAIFNAVVYFVTEGQSDEKVSKL